MWDGTLALLRDDPAEAQRCSAEGVALAGGAPNFSDGHVAQTCSILRSEGRGAELYHSLQAWVASEPDEVAWRAAFLTTAAEAGDEPAAREGLERIRTELWPFRRTRTHVVTLAFLAEAAWRVSDAETAALVADELSPYRGTHVVVATATGCEGPVDHYRALAVATAGDHREAAALAHRSVHQAQRFGSKLLLRRCEDLVASLV